MQYTGTDGVGVPCVQMEFQNFMIWMADKADGKPQEDRSKVNNWSDWNDQQLSKRVTATGSNALSRWAVALQQITMAVPAVILALYVIGEIRSEFW